MPDPAAPPIPPLDYYRVLREQIQHEDNLLTQRLNWFLTSQSFLFTAYTIAAVNTPAAARANTIRSAMLLLLPILGLSVAALVLCTVLAATAAMAILRREFKDHAQHFNFAPVDLPPVQGYRATQLFGLAAPVLLPAVFAGAWLFLLLK